MKNSFVEKNYKNKKKVKTIQLFLLFISSILIYDIFFCNSLFVSNFFKKNFKDLHYVFSFARCFAYVLLFILLMIARKSLIRNRLLYDNSQKKYKLINYIIVFFGLVDIGAAIVLYLFFDLRIISFSIIAILIIYLLFIYLFYSRNYKLNILMLCSVAFIFSITTDTIHPVDEVVHFTTAYNMAHGNFDDKFSYINNDIDKIPTWGNFSALSSLHVHYNANDIKIDKERAIPEKWPSNTSKPLYSFSALGIFISELLNGTIMDTFYMGRLFNCRVFLIGVACLLRMLPVKLNSFVAVITTPFLLLMSGTYNVDGLGNVLILLFIACVLKIFSDDKKKKITKNDMLILTLLSLALLFFKNAAYLFVLCLFGLIYKKIPKNKKFFFWLLIIALLLISYKLIFPSDISGGDTRGGDVSIINQLKFLFSSPIVFVRVYFMHTLNTFFNPGFYQELNAHFFFSKYSVYLTIPYLLYLIYMGLGSDDFKMKPGLKFYLFIVFALCFYFTSTTMFLAFTPVGDYIIKGYQPRYVWPFLPLLLCLLSNKHIKIIKDDYSCLRTSTVSLVLIFVFLYCSVFSRIFIQF